MRNISVNSFLIIIVSYNPLERREASKGGKEASKKSAASQSSTKGPTAATKALSSHNARRNDASSANPSTHPIKASKPPVVVPAYDEQVRSFTAM